MHSAAWFGGAPRWVCQRKETHVVGHCGWDVRNPYRSQSCHPISFNQPSLNASWWQGLEMCLCCSPDTQALVQYCWMPLTEIHYHQYVARSWAGWWDIYWSGPVWQCVATPWCNFSLMGLSASSSLSPGFYIGCNDALCYWTAVFSHGQDCFKSWQLFPKVLNCKLWGVSTVMIAAPLALS